MQPFPIERVRGQFPALADSGTVWFDNPAGTQVPRPVVEAVGVAMTHAASNLGGTFPASRNAVEIWEKAHAAMADFLGAGSPREIVIGSSMTSLTFQMSRTLGRGFEPGDEIIVTRMDHEGNVSPWLHLARDRGLAVRWVDFNRDTCHRGNVVSPLSWRSMARAAWRPSRIAQTTSDWPFRMSPAANTFGCEVR
jgi:selenocysteine lyase/cysteine desulfurase